MSQIFLTLFLTLLLTGSDDILNSDFTKLHFLSGPIAVEGAEPGDCLVVDILDGMLPYLASQAFNLF